jgi:Ca2+-binding RTX toxin-like protein
MRASANSMRPASGPVCTGLFVLTAVVGWGCGEPVNLGAYQVDCLCICEVCLAYTTVCDIDPYTGELVCIDQCTWTSNEPVPGIACADSASEGQVACGNACSNSGCGLISSGLTGAACTLHSPARVMAGLVPGATQVDIDPNLSVAVLTIDGSPAQIRPSGTIRFTGGDCASQSCPIEINWLKLDFPAFAIDGHPVEQGNVLSDGRWQGTKANDNGFVLDRSTILATANGEIDGDHNSNEFFPNDSLTGSYNVATGAFTLVGTNLVSTVGDGTVSFVLQGVTNARPPLADAGPDQTVSCSSGTGAASVTLDGSATSDPDGNLQAITWRTGSNVLGQGTTLNVQLPVGAHTVSAEAVDATMKTDRDTTLITVLDDSGPTITPAAATLSVSVCTPVPQAVTLPLPAVSDSCSPQGVSVSGAIIAINGSSIPPRPLSGGSVVLPVGTATVRWTASDGKGNVTTLDQPVEVLDAPTPSCCAAGQTTVQGTEYPDLILRAGSTPYCVLAFGAADAVTTGRGADYLSGGAGSDLLSSSGGDDVVVGNAGADLITLGPGGDVAAYGGAGDDVLQAALARSARLYGGRGNDALQGSSGDDLIVPGGGRDLTLAGWGDDTVRIYDACELAAGEVLSGGPGSDTLITSIGLPALGALGVSVLGFENVVIDTTQATLADCP